MGKTQFNVTQNNLKKLFKSLNTIQNEKYSIQNEKYSIQFEKYKSIQFEKITTLKLKAKKLKININDYATTIHT